MIKKITILSFVLLMAGCVSTPEISANKITQLTHISNEYISLPWWEKYNDQQLTDLINEVNRNNSNIKVAYLNLEKSRIYERIINADEYPTIGASGNLTREKLSATGLYPPPYAGKIINVGQLGVGINYGLDYINKNKLLSTEQSMKNTGIQYQIENVKLLIDAQVIKLYAYYQYLLLNENIVKDKINIQNNIENSYDIAFKIGKITEIELNKVKNQKIYLNNELINIVQNKNEALNMIQQFAGESYVGVLKRTDFLDVYKESPIGSIDIKNVQKRPDIKYYFYNIEAQKNHLDALRADFYPSISLTGDVGFQKVGFGELLNKKSIFWNLGPEITMPIFNADKIKNNYKIAGIDLNVFIENYNDSVFNAIKELNNALSKESTSFNVLNNQNIVFENDKMSKITAIKLLESGKISKIKYFQSEMDYLISEEKLLNTKFNYVNSKIELTQALGG